VQCQVRSCDDDPCWKTHALALEVQPPFFGGEWFTKHHFLWYRSITIQKEPPFFEMVVDFQGLLFGRYKFTHTCLAVLLFRICGDLATSVSQGLRF